MAGERFRARVGVMAVPGEGEMVVIGVRVVGCESKARDVDSVVVAGELARIAARVGAVAGEVGVGDVSIVGVGHELLQVRVGAFVVLLERVAGRVQLFRVVLER